jgi:hypothetical protein
MVSHTSLNRRGEAKAINYKHPRYKQHGPSDGYTAMGIGPKTAKAALRAEAAMQALIFAALPIPLPPADVVAAAYAGRPKRVSAIVGEKLRKMRKKAAHKMWKKIETLI